MNFKLSFIFIFLAAILNAQPQLLDKVVAVVGKNPLLLSEVETNLLQQKDRAGLKENARCRVFEDLLFQKLLLSQADRDSVVVSDGELENELNRRIQYYVGMLGGEEKFEAFYGKRISVFKDELRDDVRDQLMAQKMQQKITGDSKLTPSEVRAFFNTIPEDSLPIINSELEIAHIVKTPPISDDAKAAARVQLEGLRQRVLNGESMSVLAALYSEDPGSAKNGGYYEFGRGQMVPEFEAVAFRLKPGEVSEIFNSSYGMHFIQLVARKGEMVQARHILVAPKISQLDIVKARERLDSIQKLIIDGVITFKEAALKYSDDKDTRQNGGLIVNPAAGSTKWEIEELGQTDQQIVFILDKMQVDEVTPVMQYSGPDSKPAWRIIQLKSRTDPHKPNMKDDYTKLMNMASYEKQKRAIKEWIAKKSKTTYIKLDEEFGGCKLEYNWTINQ